MQGDCSGQTLTALLEGTPVIRLALTSFAILALAAPAFAVKYSVTILQPTGYTYSAGTAAITGNQVGYGSASGNPNHALLWSGTAASAIDLTPAGYSESLANAIVATGGVPREAGEGTLASGAQPHALLWNGTAASAIDLNPVGFDTSTAYGISTTNQVGSGSSTPFTNGSTHALLWSGTAASVVDLNPTGFTSSRALGTSASFKSGKPRTPPIKRTPCSGLVRRPAPSISNPPATAIRSAPQSPATIRSATAASAEAATFTAYCGTAPPPASSTSIPPASPTPTSTPSTETPKSAPARLSTPRPHTHALLWSGTAASALDLQQFITAELGSNFTGSEADGIADNGTIVGRVTDASFNSYAVIWKPETGVLGDYNNNGVVDMADYVRWRNGSPLFNEVATLGTNTAQDYTEWRTRFGNTSGSGAGSLSATTVPEPTSFALLACTLVVCVHRRPTRITCVIALGATGYARALQNRRLARTPISSVPTRCPRPFAPPRLCVRIILFPRPLLPHPWRSPSCPTPKRLSPNSIKKWPAPAKCSSASPMTNSRGKPTPNHTPWAGTPTTSPICLTGQPQSSHNPSSISCRRAAHATKPPA